VLTWVNELSESSAPVLLSDPHDPLVTLADRTMSHADRMPGGARISTNHGYEWTGAREDVEEPGAVSVEPVDSDLAGVPRVATFFAIYPEALGLVDGTTFCVALKLPLRGFARTAMHLAEGEQPFWLDPRFSHSLAVSVRFHRGKRDRHVVDEYDQRLMPIVQSVTGESFSDPGLAPTGSVSELESPFERSATGTAYTVVEMTTQLAIPGKSHWEACEPSDDIMGPTLTRAIDGLIHVVDAFRLAVKISMPSPARERLGPGVVALTRAADPAQGGWDMPALYAINSFALLGERYFIAGAQTPETTPETLCKMSHYLELASFGHPVTALGQLQAELDNAMFHEGNFRVVLMFAHSATEIMMDIALMAMLFEEGRTPEEAAATFAKPLKSRILTEYHLRLGGAWTPKGSNAVAVWLRDVLLLRHGVVHAGYLPRYEEARGAREAHYSLGRHLRDRLAARAKRYPFTAGLLVTSAGFERRDIRTKAAEDAVRAEAERIEEFVSWRNELIQLRA
jgi:hypothetical protein